MKITGDGLLATFDGPGRRIRCAAALRDELRGIGVQLRVGLHTGEVELRGGDVGGIAVHIAARVMAAAGPGEIFASRTVRDLIVGSDLVLDDRGTQRLRGVEGTCGGGALTGPSDDRLPASPLAGEPGVPTFRSRGGASGAARPDTDGGVLEPGRVLDCHLDLVLDPVEHAAPASVRNQAPQVSNQLRDRPLEHQPAAADGQPPAHHFAVARRAVLGRSAGAVHSDPCSARRCRRQPPRSAREAIWVCLHDTSES